MVLGTKEIRRFKFLTHSIKDFRDVLYREKTTDENLSSRTVGDHRHIMKYPVVLVKM